MRDTAFNYWPTIDMVPGHVHAGRAFTMSDVNTNVANNGTFDTLFRVASGYSLHLLIEAGGSGAMIEQLYESPFVNAASIGTGVTVQNRNRTKANTSTSSVYRDPYINAASIGTRLMNDYIAGGNQGQTPGTNHPKSEEWILASGRDYLYRLTNVSGGVAALSSILLFYEVADNLLT